MNRNLLLAIAIAGVVLLTWYELVLTVRLQPDIATATLVSLVFTLIALALFIERASEVYLGIWRRSGRADRLRAVREANHQVKETTDALNRLGADPTASKAEIGTYMTALADQKAAASRAASALSTYRAETAQIAMFVNVALGLAIACIGARALEPLFAWPEVSGTLQAPGPFFVLVDILVTGALLGGGADGLHKIVSVFTAYADETKDKVQNAGPAA